MAQMSAKCLLSKTEKVQISAQMQIICALWSLCCQDAKHFRSVRCHTLTSPSAEAERVGVLGDAGQPVPVPVQAAEERFGKHTLQLYCIQCTLVFSLRLERVLHRTENIILYICKR